MSVHKLVNCVRRNHGCDIKQIQEKHRDIFLVRSAGSTCAIAPLWKRPDMQMITRPFDLAKTMMDVQQQCPVNPSILWENKNWSGSPWICRRLLLRAGLWELDLTHQVRWSFWVPQEWPQPMQPPAQQQGRWTGKRSVCVITQTFQVTTSSSAIGGNHVCVCITKLRHNTAAYIYVPVAKACPEGVQDYMML